MRRLTLGAVCALAGVVLAACATTYNDTRAATYGAPTARLDIEAHQWLLGPGGTISIVRPTHPATFALTGDRASGVAPCNRYTASVDLHNDSIRIRDIARSHRSCAAPTESAERAFFAALEGATHASVVDRRLVLTNDRSLRLEFDPFDARTALPGKWTVTSPAGSHAELTFTDDGQVMLETRCTTSEASWKLEGDFLTVEHLRRSRTQRCTEAEDEATTDEALRAALASAHVVEVNPRTLTILDRDSRVVMIATASGG